MASKAVDAALVVRHVRVRRFATGLGISPRRTNDDDRERRHVGFHGALRENPKG
jgi:hypothetical protein